MSTSPLSEEFKALSNLSESLDEPSRHARICQAINRLRRKTFSFIDTERGWIHEEAIKFVSTRRINQHYYRPVEDILLHLRYQLIDLLSCLDSDPSYEIASKIDTDLDLLKPFLNVIRISPNLERFPYDPCAFTFYRSRHLYHKFHELSSDLNRIFHSFALLFEPNNLNRQWNDDSSHYSSFSLHQRLENDVYHVTYDIIVLVDELNQPTWTMMDTEWNVLIQRMEEMLSSTVLVANRLHLNQKHPEKQIIWNRMNAFTVFIKLCRLVMNKVYKFTEQPPHLGSRMRFDQLELLQIKMEAILDTNLEKLHTWIKLSPNLSRYRINHLLQSIIQSIDGISFIFQDHISSLNPIEDNDQLFVQTCCNWCHAWRHSFDVAIDNFLRYF